jgi:hypothetical protein
VEDFVGQRIILFKELPSSEYIPDLVARGILRAGMTFLTGSCYAGGGIYPETTAYLTSGSTSDAAAAGACPYPNDPVACAIWEAEQSIHKLSFGIPQAFNAFVFAQVRSGSRDQWMRDAEGVVGELAGSDDYFAAAHLIGCGPYNTVFEFLSSDHQRLQRLIRVLTDREEVEDVMVGHLAAEDALGFGGAGAQSSS